MKYNIQDLIQRIVSSPRNTIPMLIQVKKQDKKAEIEFSARQVGRYKYYDQLDQKRREIELEILGVAKMQNQLILDVGCGSGAYGLIFARKGNKVVGLDISLDLLKIAKFWADQERLTYTPIGGDTERLPFKDESFNVCLCGGILHHLPFMKQTVAELYRIIKPGGIIAMIEPNGSNPIVRLSYIFRLLLLRDICERTGCTSRNERAYPYRYYIKTLREAGFIRVKYNSHSVVRVRRWIREIVNDSFEKALVRFLLVCREFTFIPVAKLIPQPYKWPTLYITAVKSIRSNT